jgi:2-hydroxyacyl-CoA lyase 1
MGVGLGLVVASCVVHPDRPVVHVSGDSAIGFSGMEMETCCRYKMPVKIIVLNNGGIGSGAASQPVNPMQAAPGHLTVGCRYDLMMEAFGGKGYFVKDPKDLKPALEGAMAHKGPVLVNVQLHHAAGRKPQQFAWHGSPEEA